MRTEDKAWRILGVTEDIHTFNENQGVVDPRQKSSNQRVGKNVLTLEW